MRSRTLRQKNVWFVGYNTLKIKGENMNIEKFESMLKQIKVLSNKLEDRKLHGNNNYNLFVALLDIND